MEGPLNPPDRKMGANWRGGRSVTIRGYVRVWAPDHPLANRDGYVLEHRKVVYDAGIEIPEGFHVHHVNEDPSDNRLENLEVVPASEHWRKHAGVAGEVSNQYGRFSLDAVEVRERRRLARQRQRMDRAQRLAEAPHGKASTYTNWMCRCDACRTAYLDKRRSRRVVA
jgi:hypothetical protein